MLFLTIENDPRFYTVNIDLSSGFLASDGANVTNVTNLRDSGGNLLGPGVADTEGITLSNGGNVFISSEGIGSEADLFIREFDVSTGSQLDDLTIPTKFLTNGTNAGVRRNLGFESLTFSPDKSTLFTTTERALFQDSSDGDLDAGNNLLRILQFDQFGNSYNPGSEFLYQPENSHRVTDLLALDNQKLLSVERGDSIKIFEVSLGGATDISANNALNSSTLGITSVEKNLLLDFSTLDTPLSGKFEGITFGSILPNGQRSLILVSDNDFENETSTKFVAFSVQSVPFTSSPILGFFMIGGWAIAHQLKKTKI